MAQKKKKELIVTGGFSFENQEEANQAKKEIEGIKYVKSKADMENPQVVLQVYNKMIQQKLFETAVGYSYLKDLQEYLFTIPAIQNEEILPIPVTHPKLEKSLQNPKAFKILKIVNAALVFCIVVMFALVLTNDNPTIFDYETKIINKYASWEQELTEREQIVQQKEREFQIEQKAE